MEKPYGRKGRLGNFNYIRFNANLFLQTSTNCEVYEKDGRYFVYVISATGSEYYDVHLIAIADSPTQAQEIADKVVW